MMSDFETEDMVALFDSYRTALALNNMAVTLLERNAYHHSLETFKDAIGLMKLVCQSAAAASHENCLTSVGVTKSWRSDLQSKLQRATRRVIESKSSYGTCPSASIHVEAHDDSDLSSLETALFDKPACFGNLSCIYPIRIIQNAACSRRQCGIEFSLASVGEACNSVQVEVQSAIMLYNFALAHIMFAHATRSTQLLKGAMTFLDLSYSLLSKLSRECLETDQDQMADVMEENVHYFVLMAVILCTCVPCFIKLNLILPAQQALERFQLVVRALQECEESLPQDVSATTSRIKRAAAAA